MKNIKKLIAMALVMACTATAVSCSTTTSNNTTTNSNITVINPNTVLATVGGVEITLNDVDSELSAFIEQIKTTFGENYETSIDEETFSYLNQQRADVLNQMIQEKILLTKADELQIVPTEQELNKLIEANIKELQEFYGGEKELEEAKKTYGYTDETFNAFVKSQVIQELVVEHVTKDVTVSEEEIKNFYETNKKEYFTQGIGANAQHILFENEEDALKCKKEIDSKKITFDEAFKKYLENKSNDTLPLSEDLGFVQYEEPYFDKDFLAGFKNVKEGEVSEPVKSSFGYHLIKVSGITKEEVVTPLEEVKGSILSQIEYEKKYEVYQNQLTEWKKEMNVSITASAINYTPEEEVDSTENSNKEETETSETTKEEENSK